MNRRLDYQIIADWVAPGSKVLDLGCGDGTLLRQLKEQRAVQGYGIEIDDDNVLACAANGVNVIQMDIEAGLSVFESGSFDCVVLSQTLQTMKRTDQVVAEMLRLGREVIVTLPNFGHWLNRWQLLRGRMPVSRQLPYQWHDTPNVHFCTLADFEDFCSARGIAIRERLCLNDGRRVSFASNLFANLAIYRLARA